MRTRLVLFAFSLALACHAQQTRQAVTPLGTFTSCLESASVIGQQTRFSSGGAFAAIYHNADLQILIVDLSTCKATPVLPPPSTVSHDFATMTIADDGTLYFVGYQRTPAGILSGTFRLNPDGSTAPVIIDGQTYPGLGKVTYPSLPILSRDGKTVYTNAYLDNKSAGLIAYSAETEALTAVYSSTVLTDLTFWAQSAEADVVYGYLNKVQSNYDGSRLAVFDVKTRTVTALTGTYPTIDGRVYDLSVESDGTPVIFFSASASSRRGLFFWAFRRGTSVAAVLFYSARSKTVSRIGNAEVNQNTIMSSNYNGEGTFEIRVPGVNFTSSVYSLNQDTLTPTLVAGTDNCPFPNDAQCGAAFPRISEDGRITFVYRRLLQGLFVYSLLTFRPSEPYIFPEGVAGSASGAGQATRLDWLSLFGHGFSDCTEQPFKEGQFLTNGCTGVSGAPPVQVLVNGAAAPLSYVSSGQINAQMPKEIAVGAEATVQVVRGSTVSAPRKISVVSAAPSFFLHDGAAIATHADGSLVTISSPAVVGESISLWVAGLGQTVADPENGSGFVGNPLPKTINPVQVTIGGTPVVPAYAGGAPTLTGLYQIVVQIPSPQNPLQSGETGPVPMVLTTLGQTAASTIVLKTIPGPK